MVNGYGDEVVSYTCMLILMVNSLQGMTRKPPFPSQSLFVRLIKIPGSRGIILFAPPTCTEYPKKSFLSCPYGGSMAWTERPLIDSTNCFMMWMNFGGFQSVNCFNSRTT